MSRSERVAVIGAGRTRFGELFDRSLISLVAEAGIKALEDANVSRHELDEMFIGTFVPEIQNDQGNFSALLCEEIGINIPTTRVEAACASGGAAVYNGARAIKSGECDLVLVGGAEKATDRNAREAYMAAASEWERLYSFDFISLNAILTQRYLFEYNETSMEDFSLVSVKNHKHALRNPNAHFRKEITVEKVLNSPMISDPVKLLDCSPVSDGSAAIILASEERAKQLADDPVYLTGCGMNSDTIGLYARSSLSHLKATVMASSTAFKRSGLSISEVDLFELHDAYIIQEVMGYEDLGIVDNGQGPRLVREAFENSSEDSDHIVYESRGKDFVVNAGGGLKADGHPVGATGVRQIGEIYQQMTGKTPYPIEKSLGRTPEVGLAQNVGGSGSNVTVSLLETKSHMKSRLDRGGKR